MYLFSRPCYTRMGINQCIFGHYWCNMALFRKNKLVSCKRYKLHVSQSKTRIRLHICAVWSETSMGTLLVAKGPTFLQIKTTKILLRLCGCQDWLESSLYTHANLYPYAGYQLNWEIWKQCSQSCCTQNWQLLAILSAIFEWGKVVKYSLIFLRTKILSVDVVMHAFRFKITRK